MTSRKDGEMFASHFCNFARAMIRGIKEFQWGGRSYAPTLYSMGCYRDFDFLQPGRFAARAKFTTDFAHPIVGAGGRPAGQNRSPWRKHPAQRAAHYSPR